MISIAMIGMVHAHTEKILAALKNSKCLHLAGASTDDKMARALFCRTMENTPVYNSANELLRKHPDIQAVIISSETCRHMTDFEACAACGLDILITDCPSFDPSEYNRMICLTKQYGILCQTANVLYSNPVIRRLSDSVAKGEIGRLQAVQITQSNICPAGIFSWYADPEKQFGERIPIDNGGTRFRGGALCGSSPLFDLIRTLTDSEFETVYTECGHNLRPELAVEDILHINAKMKNGIIVSLDPSWSRLENGAAQSETLSAIDPKAEELNIHICGDKGSLIADCLHPNVYSDGGPDRRYTVRMKRENEWIGVLETFADSITSRQVQNDLVGYRGNIEAILACYDSIRTGQPIKIKEMS